MKVKVKRHRCGCCVWNRVGECGVHFCVFPHCILEKERPSHPEKKTSRGAAAARDARRPRAAGKDGEQSKTRGRAGGRGLPEGQGLRPVRDAAKNQEKRIGV